MKVDIDNMNAKELDELQKRIEKARESLESRRRAEARQAAEKAALDYGFKLDELQGKPRKAQKNPPKYMNPEDPTQTWTGRGRQPAWIKEALASGKSLDKFRI